MSPPEEYPPRITFPMLKYFLTSSIAAKTLMASFLGCQQAPSRPPSDMPIYFCVCLLKLYVNFDFKKMLFTQPSFYFES